MRSQESMSFEDPDDPFVAQGDSLIYCNSHLMTIYLCEKPDITQKLPNQEDIIVKIILVGERDNLKEIRIQLSSDNELNFYFHFSCNEMDFRRIR